MLAANEVLSVRVLVADKAGDFGIGDGLSLRSKRLESKTRRLASQKSVKSQKLSK